MVWSQEEQAGSDADKHVTSRPRIRKKARRYPVGKVGSHSSFLTITTREVATSFVKLIWSKAQEIGVKPYQTFSYAVVHIGDSPAECIAGVVQHNQTILYERSSEVTLNDTANQAATTEKVRPHQELY